MDILHFSPFYRLTDVTSPSQVHSSPDKVEPRNILQVLHSSLSDHAISGAENEVRYKLIIDPSEDGSLVRLLFSSGVLQRENTKVYVCSNFPGDVQLQRVGVYTIQMKGKSHLGLNSACLFV